jgi:hypothetical protein
MAAGWPESANVEHRENDESARIPPELEKELGDAYTAYFQNGTGTLEEVRAAQHKVRKLLGAEGTKDPQIPLDRSLWGTPMSKKLGYNDVPGGLAR